CRPDERHQELRRVAGRLPQGDLTHNTTSLWPENAVEDMSMLSAQDRGDLLLWGNLSWAKTVHADGLGRRIEIDDRAILIGGGTQIFPRTGGPGRCGSSSALPPASAYRS